MTGRRRAALVVALALGVIACGQGSGVSATAAAGLEPHVRAARAAAERGDPAAAAAELGALRQRVTDLRREGELSDDQAATILAASAEVEAELSRLAPATAPPTTPPPTTAPPTTPPPTAAPPTGPPEDPPGKAPKDRGRGPADDDGDEAPPGRDDDDD